MHKLDPKAGANYGFCYVYIFSVVRTGQCHPSVAVLHVLCPLLSNYCIRVAFKLLLKTIPGEPGRQVPIIRYDIWRGATIAPSNRPVLLQNHHHFNTQFLVFDTKFLVFETKFLVFTTQFIIFTDRPNNIVRAGGIMMVIMILKSSSF